MKGFMEEDEYDPYMEETVEDLDVGDFSCLTELMQSKYSTNNYVPNF